MADRKPGLAETLATLAATAVTVYMVMPPQERMWLRLHALGSLRRTAARLAWREGHRGMGDELAGREYWRYGVTYWLSRARDGLDAVIREMRP